MADRIQVAERLLNSLASECTDYLGRLNQAGRTATSSAYSEVQHQRLRALALIHAAFDEVEAANAP